MAPCHANTTKQHATLPHSPVEHLEVDVEGRRGVAINLQVGLQLNIASCYANITKHRTHQLSILRLT
jgi:hypothetical protein